MNPPIIYTQEAYEAFLDVLASGLTVIDAAEAAGIPLRHIYKRREADPAFKAQWAEAYMIGNNALEKAARRRGVDGWNEPVFHQGEVCGTVRKYSDSLLMFLMKARDPYKYCDRTRAAQIEREIAEMIEKSNSSATVTAANILERLEKLAAEKAALAKPPE